MTADSPTTMQSRETPASGSANNNREAVLALLAEFRRLRGQEFCLDALGLLSLTGRVKTLAFRRRLSARARRINFGDGGIPAWRAHCIRNPSASGLDHEVQ